MSFGLSFQQSYRHYWQLFFSKCFSFIPLQITGQATVLFKGLYLRLNRRRVPLLWLWDYISIILQMLCNRGNYGCKQTNNRTEQLSGVGQLLKYSKHTHIHRKIHRQKNFQARMNHRDHRHFLTIIYRKWFFPGDTRQFKNTARFYFKKANDEVECINRKGIPSLIQKHLLKARSLSSS